MPIDNPNQLVEEFKKSGEFERLRHELLAQVSQGGDLLKAEMAILQTRVGEVAQQRFTSDPKLSFMPQEAIYRDLMLEMERFPVVDRVAEDVQMLSDPSFTENIRKAVHKILLESKGQKSPPPKDEQSEVMSKPNVIPTTIHPSTVTNHPEQAPISGQSVVVTPAAQLTALPHATVEETPIRALDNGLELTKPDATPTVATSAVSGSAIITTSGTDVEMVDGSQPDAMTS